MLDLLVATTNPGKLREYAELFESLPIRFLSLRDVGLADMDVEETETTFEGNAELKARAYAQASGLVTLADDSGLVVDALGGAPGVYTARYAGPGKSDRDRIDKVLREMEAVPDDQRAARFVCAISLADPRTLLPITVRGVVEGRIAHTPDESGGGFGLDPIFIPNGYDVALSAVPSSEKNRISHRARATQQLLPILQQMMQDKGE